MKIKYNVFLWNDLFMASLRFLFLLLLLSPFLLLDHLLLLWLPPPLVLHHLLHLLLSLAGPPRPPASSPRSGQDLRGALEEADLLLWFCCFGLRALSGENAPVEAANEEPNESQSQWVSVEVNHKKTRHLSVESTSIRETQQLFKAVFTHFFCSFWLCTCKLLPHGGNSGKSHIDRWPLSNAAFSTDLLMSCMPSWGLDVSIFLQLRRLLVFSSFCVLHFLTGVWQVTVAAFKRPEF